MKRIVVLLLLFYPLCAEEPFPIPQMTQRKDVKTRENYFQTSTPYKITPNVNPVTGDLIEEEADLVVAGAEPLSVRRFYSHTGVYEPRSGGWRYNPESFLVANFELSDQDIFASLGEFDGSITSYKPSGEPGCFTFDVPSGYANFNPTGQSHPLNTKIYYRKARDKKEKDIFRWVGKATDGSGRIRFFETAKFPWMSIITETHRRGFNLQSIWYWPDIWTPYPLPIQEEIRPNGNVIRYTYTGWKKTKLYPKLPLIETITAYNANKTKVLGSIVFHYDKDKREDVRGIRVTGSDGRQASMHHQGSTPILLHSVNTPNKPSVFYNYQNQWINRIDKPEGRVLKTEYNTEGKVAAQYAPVGPKGEMHPIGRYIYLSYMTQVIDAEGNMTDYHFDPNKRLQSIVTIDNHKVYRAERMDWDAATGNCVRKTIVDAQDTPVRITEYAYDANQNPVEERIGDGKAWHTVKRTYSEDGFNLKLSESDREGVVSRFHYRPGTNLLTAELVYDADKIVKRTFHTYDDCAICIKTIQDDGSSLDEDDLEGVTYRRITEVRPKQSLPCYGLPEEVLEKTIDATGQEILLKKVIYTYAPFGKILREKHYDASNQYSYTIHNTYDDQERLASTTDPLGNCTSFTYDANHNLTSITGPNPDQYKEIVYDQANRPIRISDRQADGSTLTIEKKYDRLGQLIAETDACGNETCFEYDVLGRVTTVYHPDGSIEKNEYDVLGNATKKIDGEGYETCTTYNFQGKPTAIYYPDGREEHFTYNSTGTIATHVDKNGAKSVYTYDLFDRPTDITVYSSAGEVLKTTQSTYSPFCRLSETDGEGVTTTFTYDFCGRKIAEQTDTKKTSYAYDSLGRLTRTDNGDYQIIETYDNAGRVIAKQILDSSGKLQFEEEYAYDASGNRTHLINSKGAYETLYNTFGKPLSEKNPLGFGTTYTYKYGKEHTETNTDPNGIQTVRVYDTRGRESEIRKLNRSGKIISQSLNHYNKNGKLIQLSHIVFDGTTPLKTISHQWEYGPMGRLECFVEAGEKETQYLYDARGRLATIKKPSGVEIHHEWDDLGRLARYFSSDFDYRYLYDSNDRPITIYDAVTKKKTTRAYNALGDMEEETLANGLKVLNSFDTQGRRVTLTLPDTSSIEYAYQGAYLHAASRHNAHFVYEQRDLQGNFNLATLPHQLGQISINRDPLSRWQVFESPYYQAQFSEKAYDPNGNLLHYTYEDSLGKVECSYKYDDHNQLISENEHSYQFDSLHNRLQKDEFPHEVNALCQTLHDGRTAYEYDLDGNLVFDGEWHYTYDTQDRLITLEKGTQRVEYTYDPFHRRLCKQVFSKGKQIHSERYLWDGDNEIGAFSDRDTIEQLRVLGEGLGAEIGAAVLYELKGKTYVPIHDHRGCVVALVDPKAQQAIESYRYTAFGEELTGGTLSPWRFSSKRVEEETGLLFFGRRYYFPALGKWITQDPEGLENGPNLYAYVSNCPLTRFDLYGLREYMYDWDALDFPGLSYSTLLRANRIDPYFSQFESSFTHKSHIYNLPGRPDLPEGAWIGFCNGIRNIPEQATENLIHLSDLSGGYNLHGMYRGSRNTMVDLLGCWMGYQGTVTDAVRVIHQAWNEQFDKVPDSLLLHFCTSGGAISTKQALIEYSEERRKNIRVVAIAPADYISRDLCHSVRHYEAHLWRDAIPWIRWKERWKNRDTIKVLPSHPTADLHDHSFQSKTFEESILFEVNYYKDLLSN